MSLADKAVFPQQQEVPQKMDARTTYFKTEVTGGMTLLEHYAGLALQGFCANPAIFAANERCGWGLVNCTNEQLAAYGRQLAHAWIAELEKVKP